MRWGMPTQPNAGQTSNRHHLTTRQLSERWGFHHESVRRMIRQGRIPAIRIGGRLRIRVGDVEAIEAKGALVQKEVA